MTDPNAKKDQTGKENLTTVDDDLLEILEEKEVDLDKEMDTDDDGSKLRTFSSAKVKKTLMFIAICVSLYHIYALIFALSKPLIVYAVHWAIGLILIFIYYPVSKNGSKKRVNPIDIILIIGVLTAAIYVIRDPGGLDARHVYFQPNQWDIILGGFAILATLEAGRRSIGLGLPVVSIVLILYALFGNNIPGDWASKGYSLQRVISHVFSIDGLFGTPIKMSALYIFMLTLFGAFLYVCGAGDMFLRFATSAFGNKRGGPAKISIIASGLFGSISGSAVSNVVSTGIFTIPLMKKTGYRSEFAGAVEAVASTGGQIMPPIMGSGAFIMAELLGRSYGSIALAAVIPALLYFFALYVAVDCEAARCDFSRVDTSSMEKASKIIKKGWFQLLPVIVLVIMLAVFRETVIRAAFAAIITCIVACGLKKDTRLSVKQIFTALELGCMRSLSIISACACAGIAIAAITLTGLGLKFTILVTHLAGDSLFLALVFSALATIILGMGLPTVAAYVVSASVLAGSLVELGIPALAAHFFLFYFSILSQITPPVAMAAYAAGNIANANPNRVGFTAVRLGLVAFVMPFLIVYGPALIGIGTPIEVMITAATAIIGVFCFTVAQFGFFAGTKFHIVSRLLLIGASFCMIIPGYFTDIVGIIGVVSGLLSHRPLREKLLRRHKT